MNELAGQIIREGCGVENVTWDNMEQVYNPINSGVASLAKQRVKLISQGMSVKMADDLCQQYLNQLVREGEVYSMMDFFTDAKAKLALHRKDLTIDEVALNYQSRRPFSKSIKDGVAEIMGSQKLAPIKPRGVMGNLQLRMFSSSPIDEEEKEQAIIDAQI
jgi:hypothetical protein